MTLNEFQTQAMKTKQPNAAGLLYDAVALAGEAGEVCNEVKKVHRDWSGVVTHERLDKLRDELGDVLWYVANMAFDLGISLETIAEVNIKKLEARYEAKQIAAAYRSAIIDGAAYSPVREFDRPGDKYTPSHNVRW